LLETFVSFKTASFFVAIAGRVCIETQNATETTISTNGNICTTILRRLNCCTWCAAIRKQLERAWLGCPYQGSVVERSREICSLKASKANVKLA